MKKIRITRTFLKKPVNSVLLLLALYSLLEVLGWSFGYKHKLIQVKKSGGALQYINDVLLTMIVPELFTVSILFYLINKTHKWFGIYNLDNKWGSIVRYQLYFIPVLCLSFFAFNPITQTVRYLIETPVLKDHFNYSWEKYWGNYIIYTYGYKIYFQYLTPILLIGYTSINISLFKDYLRQYRDAAETEKNEALQRVLALSDSFSLTSNYIVLSPYLASLKGRNAQGELDFPVKDAYYFTIEERLYYAELAKGRYLISKTLNELEAELDPRQFFRIKRDYIVNRQAILSYSHWENGKYIVRLNTPKGQDIVIPRTRMQELREWLQKDIKELLEVS